MRDARAEDVPARERALVLERWNSWVRVWLPASGETRWVDLAERGWSAEADAPAAAPGSEEPRPGVGTG
ncbi:MAG: hypothetical protein QF903_00885 [Planctomycetota bacterium]|jgi:hypothetical protein|nr:hypothetical protein [Planctomycetota bacterium]MDP6761421.1 hypothetical protein [Planctomycetota bacterium]MDP6988016.1 hypothetical protein [Planctomycetota bacterium]